MITHPRYISIVGDNVLDPKLRGEVAIRRAVRYLSGRCSPILWLASGVGAASQVAIDELLELGERVRVVLPSASSFLAQHPSTSKRGSLADQIALGKSIGRARVPRHVRASQLARRLVQVADLLVVFWSGNARASEVVTLIVEANLREVPILWVPLPRR